MRGTCALSGLAIWLAMAMVGAAQDIVPPSSLKGQLLDLASRTNSAATGIPQTVNETDVDLLSTLTSLEVSTMPSGTSTGSFNFTFDPTSGTFERSARTFGPAFGKRSLTNGKGMLSAGFNWLHANYDSLGGLDLTNGDVQPVKDARSISGGPVPLPGASVLRADIESDTFVGFVNFGFTDRLDVGIAVPWVRIAVGADVALVKDGIDITPGGNELVMRKTSSAGIGDVAITAKYRFWKREEGGAALGVDVWLPTGDGNNLRGTGVTRTLVSGIWSLGGRVSPHVSCGFEYWSDGVTLSQDGSVEAKNQIVYAAGLEVASHSRATLMLDLVGRRQLQGGKMGYRTKPLGPFLVDVLEALPEAIDVVSFAPGVKWNAGGNALLVASVLAAVENQGLRANIVPVVGFEWTF